MNDISIDGPPARPEPVTADPSDLSDPGDDGSSLPLVVRPVLAPLLRQYRSAEKRLARNPATRMLATVPKTTGFAVRTLRRRRHESPAGLPDTRLTPGLVGYVALDEAILTLAMGPERFPHRADYHRVSAELAEALELYAARGWISDPASYHRTPPALALEDVQITNGWAHRLRYERIHFPSSFEPQAGEPGRDRWQGYHTNRTASAWVLRHRDDAPRPWIVCVHGFGMGQAFMEFPAFHAAHLHHDLGCNLIGPTLPLHGNRKVGKMSGDQFLSFDLMNAVHGVAQSLWDVRRVLSWVRTQDPAGVGVYGISLGAYVAALLADFEPDLDAVVAGIPVTDFPALFASQSPAIIRRRSIEHGILGGPAEDVHRVVSPLAMAPVVAPEARFIFAGLGDRMSHPRQAHNLWRHWGEPRIRWYPGNHIGYMWSSKVRSFVDEVLHERGLTRPGSDDAELARVGSMANVAGA